MRVAPFRSIGLLRGIVVRQVNTFPPTVIELRTVRTGIMDGSGLGEIVEILRSATEITPDIRGMTIGETPSGIERNNRTLVHSHGRNQGKKESDEETWHIVTHI